MITVVHANKVIDINIENLNMNGKTTISEIFNTPLDKFSIEMNEAEIQIPEFLAIFDHVSYPFYSWAVSPLSLNPKFHHCDCYITRDINIAILALRLEHLFKN